MNQKMNSKMDLTISKYQIFTSGSKPRSFPAELTYASGEKVLTNESKNTRFES